MENVAFEGFVADVPSIWADHHCLALPSRAEGLPLVLVEAMLSGRVPIATATAGIPEVVTDGEDGFLATAPTEAAYDEALERAWQQRDRLREIGSKAAENMRHLVPEDPAREFADRLLALTDH
jgi:glycosyltransferase involved in cell wall biosynthesis